MKVIDRRTHGYLDYIVGALLIAAPWIFGFNDHDTATMVPVILGGSTILYSILTDYELGAIHAIPFRAHLTIDMLSGVFLAASPWLFGFADRVYLPHLIAGILEIGVVMMTNASSSRSRNHAGSTSPGAVRQFF